MYWLQWKFISALLWKMLFNEISIHILEFYLFIHEIEISWIWNYFKMWLKNFIHKTHVDTMIFSNLKIEHVLSY
jgi:hypothetical protein